MRATLREHFQNLLLWVWGTDREELDAETEEERRQIQRRRAERRLKQREARRKYLEADARVSFRGPRE